MFKLNDKIISRAFPELGTGHVHLVWNRTSKFTKEPYIAVFIKWQIGSITTHRYPLPDGVLDWRLELFKKNE